MSRLRFALRWTRYTIEAGTALTLIGIAWIIWDQDRHGPK